MKILGQLLRNVSPVYLMLIVACSTQKNKEDFGNQRFEKIEKYVYHVQERRGVPGVSLAYFIAKKYDLAIKNYQKAIALGGTNGNAKRMLQRINENKRSNL